jgi:hypothetical protein
MLSDVGIDASSFRYTPLELVGKFHRAIPMNLVFVLRIAHSKAASTLVVAAGLRRLGKLEPRTTNETRTFHDPGVPHGPRATRTRRLLILRGFRKPKINIENSKSKRPTGTEGSRESVPQTSLIQLQTGDGCTILQSCPANGNICRLFFNRNSKTTVVSYGSVRPIVSFSVRLIIIGGHD